MVSLKSQFKKFKSHIVFKSRPELRGRYLLLPVMDTSLMVLTKRASAMMGMGTYLVVLVMRAVYGAILHGSTGGLPIAGQFDKRKV